MQWLTQYQSFQQFCVYQTLLARALTCGRESIMYSLCECALASIICWIYFSSSLLRRPLTPTIGWLERVIVARLSGCIHDRTYNIHCTTLPANNILIHHTALISLPMSCQFGAPARFPVLNLHWKFIWSFDCTLRPTVFGAITIVMFCTAPFNRYYYYTVFQKL